MVVENHSGAGTNRKLSGAQKRKLRKQQALQEGTEPPKKGSDRCQKQREKKRALTAPDTSQKTPGQLPERQRLPKRQASSSLEMPNKQNQLKRPKTQGTYASVASNLPRVTLTCGEYLGGEMPIDVCNRLKEAVVSRVLLMDDGDFVPKFSDSFKRKGAVIFVCEDKETKTWLEKEAENLDLGQDLKARVVQPEELRITKVKTWIPAGVKSVEDFLKLVRKQNGGVDTTKWAILKQTPEGCLILGLDEPSAVTLKSRGLQLLVGVGRATFKLLGPKPSGRKTPT